MNSPPAKPRQPMLMRLPPLSRQKKAARRLRQLCDRQTTRSRISASIQKWHRSAGETILQPEDDDLEAALECPEHFPQAEDAAPESVASEPSQAEVPRPAGKYRPRLHPRPLDERNGRPPRRQSQDTDAGRGTLDSEVILIFQPGGWGIQASLLFRRAPDMPEDLPIRLGQDAYDLSAIGADFYEPIAISNLQDALAGGIAAEAAGDASCRWARGGRSLHVFTARTGVAGFVSTARIVIGQENALLCTGDVAESALRACEAAGAAPPVEISGPGVPSGWRCFRGIRPIIAAASPEGDGILLALVPHPQAAIELGGGMPMNRSAWLAGHPPSIRVVGAAPKPGEVTIDGHPAACSAAGEWTANGWDTHGSHTICYAGLTRTYEIAPPPGSWERWPAHAANGLALCGALALDETGLPAFVSEGGFLWLLGSTPGQAQFASRGEGLPLDVAAPRFRPVWAVTLHPGRGRRHTAELIGPADPPENPTGAVTPFDLGNWCRVLHTAGRDPDSLQQRAEPEVAELWMAYRNTAREIRRRAR